jgi:hypothetical protein
MPSHTYAVLAGAVALFGSAASGEARAEPQPRNGRPAALATEMERTSFGVALGRDWFPRGRGTSATPRASYLGIWVLRDVTPRLAFGVQGSASVNVFGCDGDESCHVYRLLRLGGLAEFRLPLVQDATQGLELFGTIGPELVRTSEPGDQRTAKAAPWGIGATGRIGPRLRMRWLTLAPYGELAAFSVGAHLAYGFGLQLGSFVSD